MRHALLVNCAASGAGARPTLLRKLPPRELTVDVALISIMLRVLLVDFAASGAGARPTLLQNLPPREQMVDVALISTMHRVLPAGLAVNGAGVKGMQPPPRIEAQWTKCSPVMER
jgi:hypothetical protein